MRERFVFFDLGNVLVHFDHQIAVSQLARLSGQPEAPVRSALFDSGLQDRYEHGAISSCQFAEEINAMLQTQLPVQQILDAISAIFQPNLAILPMLELLKRHKIDMAVLSNTCEAHWQWIAARQWPVMDGWFVGQILSFEVQSMKPEDGIYHAAEAMADCSGPRVFFTDDRPENVEAASRRGWSTHLFTSVTQFEPALRSWLKAS
ncbi:MAG: HAD family phosphatase [Planctomycetales bacterium]|nr:HAD family phosphatase [Planctomycetales bacterium]